MNDALADTQSIIWFLFDPPRLSPAADAALTAATQSGTLFIPTITLVEVSYLEGKKSFPYSGVLSRLFAVLADPTEPIEALPLTVPVAQAMALVPRAEVPDMPDRIVAATAVAHRIRVVSSDADIRGSASLKALVPVIW